MFPRRRWKFAHWTAFCLIAIVSHGCSPSVATVEPFKQSFPTMSTVASITLYAPSEQASKAADGIRAAFDEVTRSCNRYDPESELSKLNRDAFKEPFRCGDTLWRMLREARQYYEVSGGGFDVTVGPLMELWGFHRKRATLPDADETAEAMSKVGLGLVEFDDSARTVRFKKEGVSIDLGGIAKGVAVDMGAEAALAAGVRSGIVNLGGNLRCLPEPPPGKKAYSIGIQDPFDKDGCLGVFDVAGGLCMATSGNYERYVVIDGVRHTHIMSPTTGKPVTGMVSVTVVCPSAGRCDGLSTSVFVQGAALARGLASQDSSLGFLIVKEGEGGRHEICQMGSVLDSLRLSKTSNWVGSASYWKERFAEEMRVQKESIP